jgi:hypothetical protein
MHVFCMHQAAPTTWYHGGPSGGKLGLHHPTPYGSGRHSAVPNIPLLEACFSAVVRPIGSSIRPALVHLRADDKARAKSMIVANDSADHLCDSPHWRLRHGPDCASRLEHRGNPWSSLPDHITTTPWCNLLLGALPWLLLEPLKLHKYWVKVARYLEHGSMRHTVYHCRCFLDDTFTHFGRNLQSILRLF